MELTIDQALQQGVAAHRQGELQDAERIYRAILKVQPNHPDANHNLGLLAFSVGKNQEALPLLKRALDANSQVEQFWLSYIGALIESESVGQARQAVAEAEQHGVSRERLDTFNSQLQTMPLPTKASHEQQCQLLEHYQKNRFGDAEALARAMVAEFSQDPFGWKMLGIVLKSQGSLHESFDAMKKSVELSPEDAAAHANLGIVLHDLGRFGEAEISHRQAITLLPEFAQAHSNLGCTLNEMTRFSEAEASHRTAISLQPSSAEAHYNLGITLETVGRFEEAISSQQQAILFNAGYSDAYSKLASSLEKCGRLEEAEQAYIRAVELRPAYAEAHCNLGVVRKKLGRLEEAEAGYRRAIELQGDMVQAYTNLGNVLIKLGRHKESEASYLRAIDLEPSSAQGHYHLGLALTEMGRFSEAETSYRKALSLQPYHAEAHRNLAAITKYGSCDDHFRQMQKIYNDGDIGDDCRCHVSFALAKASADIGDFKKAFRYYEEANSIRRGQVGHDRKRDAEYFTKLKQAYHKIAAHALQSGKIVSDVVPIFIVGMPRSGTTLVEQIICSHSKVMGAGELVFASQFGSQIALGQSQADEAALLNFRLKYLDALRKRSRGNRFVTDKMPHNFRFLGLIAAALPEAKIVSVEREPAAVCWANYESYFNSSVLSYCYDLDDTIEHFKLYDDLMSFWQGAIETRIYNLCYEDLTLNQDEATGKLIHALGLEWEDACLSPEDNARSIATASNLQVRKKIYTGSSERWKHYRPFLSGKLDRALSGR